tara:strand:- start:1457 stop:2278 length:822 start_codon:yes stop_codon:yes gene_type:complete
MKRLLLILGMVSVLTGQTATIKNSIVGYSTLGDTVSFDKPYVWSFTKSDDSKWGISMFLDAPWARDKVYVEELYYKPYTDKFTIVLGRQPIPFGANIPYLDLTRGDKFTYQTPTPNDIGLLYFGDGVTIYGGVGKWFFESYYGNDIENGFEEYKAGRVSYEFGNHFVGVSLDDQNKQALDISGYGEFVDYVTEIREDYQWVRAVVRLPNMLHLKGLGLIGGFERTSDETQALYGVVYQYGESNQFVSAELSGEGDLSVKLYYGFSLKIGKENE